MVCFTYIFTSKLKNDKNISKNDYSLYQKCYFFQRTLIKELKKFFVLKYFKLSYGKSQKALAEHL